SLRASASPSSAVIATLPHGSPVTLLSLSAGWWQVEYADGHVGWSRTDSIHQVVGSRAMRISTSSSELPIRSGASTEHKILTRLPRDTVVVELSREDGWSRILYQGDQLGYVASSDLDEPSGAALDSRAILLPVPSYKQYDSRWATIRIGNEGDTMRQIGCTTSSLAMTESYRTGSVVTPAAMAARTRYTPDGFLYWPERYKPYFGSRYLAAIRAQLEAGRPVIIGTKNRAGGHWVVVTGHNGKTPLRAADFTINDPDSDSRTTLAQLLRDYPSFYKLKIYRS
ncbi:MAG: SH3 domain-containing protein, partial [Oscillospiraceae bacterium]